MPRALLSVSDKTGLIPFASGLAARNLELVSTGGTARAIAAAGLPVTNVSDITGFPEMMDGRVKTLHPAVHGGILARRAVPGDLAAISGQGIGLIDLVVVNLYPFARAAANPDTPFDHLIEEIDIGGPSMVRAAAKNFRDVLIVVDPIDYDRVLEALASPAGPSLELRFALAQKAFAHTAAYDTTIASTLGTISITTGGGSGAGESAAAQAGAGAGAGTAAGGNEAFVRAAADPDGLSPSLSVSLDRVRVLRYGENPHQRAAWYAESPARGFGAVQIRQGKELSYTNLLDLDAAARLVLEFDEPAAAVIKHTNPCGVATGTSIAQAYVTARDADALSAFGGIIGLNRTLDAETATAITSTFIEAVIAPAVDDDALAILSKKSSLRVLTADLSSFKPSAAASLEYRSILGGVLVQQRDRVAEAQEEWGIGAVPVGADAGTGLRVVTRRHPTDDEWRALRFAWRVCAHIKSNTILFTGPDRTRAVGAGQMSRVDAVKVAVMKAGGDLKGSVVASDAFFPFRDGLDALAAAGATAVVQPGGSVRDAEVIAAADEHNLAMIFTGRRHFRH
jgi:phosphoribosylaminoimidazolecarboxamide formyltransferase/IMP cyclohydrolase